MLGFIRNKYHWLFPLGGPEWIKARPQDLYGPHPKRLKMFHFVFRFSGEGGVRQELSVDVPLPPYQHDHDLPPPLDEFSRQVLEKWDASDGLRGLLVDKSMLEDDGFALIERKSFWYVGTTHFPWRFAEFEIWINVGPRELGVNYLSRAALVKQIEVDNSNAVGAPGDIPSIPPVRPVDGIISLQGAWAVRFQSRSLGGDEKKEWSPDRSCWTSAQQRELIAIPISRHRALFLDFIMKPTGEPPRRWHSRALEVIEGILSGMRFHGPWPSFEDDEN